MYDNKGNPVKKYEPFFSGTHEYEDEDDLVQWGVTPIMHYDPLGRLIRTEFPDGTESRVVFDAWHQEHWDQNDCVTVSAWLETRLATGAPPDQHQAAVQTQAHADTPSISHLDSLGRVYLTVEDNGSEGTYQTRAALDIEGNVLSIPTKANTRYVITAGIVTRVGACARMFCAKRLLQSPRNRSPNSSFDSGSAGRR
ncbi:MAG: hypothetical protein ACLFSB_16290 [Chitinispirillaceae bacterium]